jgi:hypothetical protein
MRCDHFSGIRFCKALEEKARAILRDGEAQLQV